MSSDWYCFAAEEKAELRRSWDVLGPKMNQVGADIYEMIFNQCPEARKLFPKMKYNGSKPDKKANEFSFQAMRFMQVIESAVNALDNLESMDTILYNLGRRHGKLEVTGKFRSYYWTTFLECTIFTMRKYLTSNRKFSDLEVDNAIIIWRLLLRDVMRKIKFGYSKDISHRISQMTIEDQRKYSTISALQEADDFDNIL